MGRSPCCSKDEGLNRGAWTAMEDKILTEFIRIHGEGKWRNLPKRAGLKRCGKSCRLRWLNYLRPDIKRGNITRDEEELIIRLHKLLGNRWSLIAGRLPGRTDNEIKNYWNTTIGKKIQPPDPTPVIPKIPSSSLSPKASGARTNIISCTNVVRTKASRCTKVVNIPQDDDPSQNLGNNDQIGDQLVSDRMTGINELDFSPRFLLNDDENISCEFMEDFKMDENFLSDFLDVDFSELYKNNGGEGAAATETSAPMVDNSGLDDWLIDNTAHY